MPDLLKLGLEKLKFSQDEIQRLLPIYEQYIKELVLFNSAYNLVNTNDHDEIVIKHILDSLSAQQVIKDLAEKQKEKQSRQIIIGDIGSGGGLPGIPLAASLPEFDFVLVERMPENRPPVQL